MKDLSDQNQKLPEGIIIKLSEIVKTQNQQIQAPIKLKELLENIEYILAKDIMGLVYLFNRLISEKISVGCTSEDKTKHIEKYNKLLCKIKSFKSYLDAENSSIISDQTEKTICDDEIKTLNSMEELDYNDKLKYLGNRCAKSLAKVLDKKGKILTFLTFEKVPQEGYEATIKLYDEAIKLYPKAEYHTNKAWIYDELEQYDKAIESTKEALRLNPKYENAKEAQAYALTGKGACEYSKHTKEGHENAIKFYDEAIKLYPKAVHHSNKARIYNELEQYDKAIKSAKEALKLDPTHERAKEAQAYALNIKGDSEYSSRYSKEEYEAAIKLYDEAENILSNRTKILDNSAQQFDEMLINLLGSISIGGGDSIDLNG